MRPFRLAFPLAVLLALPAGARERGAAEVEALQKAVQRAIERAEPSVACVLVSRSDAYRRWKAGPSPDTPGKLGHFDAESVLRRFRGRRDDKETDQFRRRVKELDLSDPDTSPESYGSAVVIDAAGLLLTNAHVVRNATKIFVRLPGGRGSWADVHAADPRSDLAVLRLLDKVPGLRPIAFGDGDKLRKGQFVVLLSNPYAAGFRDGSPSASWGIVSNLRRPARPGQVSENDRAKVTIHDYGTLIQTDTRVNLGCSGGALLNLEGEMIGLTTAQAAISGSDTPGGFAVPLDATVKNIINVLRRGEEVEYGFLGVILDPAPPPGGGVRLQRVTAGGPAERAGLRAEDRVVAINGHPVRQKEDLFLLIGAQLAGSKVRIEVARPPAWQRRTFDATLAKFYVPAPCIASRRPPARGGLRVDYTSILPQRGATPPWGPAPPEGVVIREVVPGSAADKAQLQVDKVITAVNGRHVTKPVEFYEAMEKANGRAELTFLNSAGRPERVTIDTR
ncbi:MAG TPA: trypsin-like peptidase domain-containing protein [Gemmataceae bacterium]|jgi:serine protease Do|nr:trypsin-like peptidase domain-containing protein [Gemmataceae bacterium]